MMGLGTGKASGHASEKVCSRELPKESRLRTSFDWEWEPGNDRKIRKKRKNDEREKGQRWEKDQENHMENCPTSYS